MITKFNLFSFYSIRKEGSVELILFYLKAVLSECSHRYPVNHEILLFCFGRRIQYSYRRFPTHHFLHSGSVLLSQDRESVVMRTLWWLLQWILEELQRFSDDAWNSLLSRALLDIVLLLEGWDARFKLWLLRQYLLLYQIIKNKNRHLENWALIDTVLWTMYMRKCSKWSKLY